MRLAEDLTISRILRVNHAGEFVAIQIYSAQIALSPRGGAVRTFLVETLSHEKDHLRRFREMMPVRNTRPCGALALWGFGGSILGALTGLLGRNAVFVCTEAVERTVHRHLDDQLAWLAGRDLGLSATISDIQAQELGHLAHAQAAQDNPGVWAKVLDGLITGATEVLIWLSTYGASSSLARDLRR